MPRLTPDTLITAGELSEHLRVSEKTLQRWRASGCGPDFCLLGGCIRYQWADVLTWQNRNKRTTR